MRKLKPLAALKWVTPTKTLSDFGNLRPTIEAAAKEADKLSYKGQLDHAKELMGQVEKDAEGKNTSQDEGDSMSFMFTMMVWGSIGTGYFMYGKSQSKYVFILCGIALCVLPIFISSATANVVLGLILIVVPFKISG